MDDAIFACSAGDGPTAALDLSASEKPGDIAVRCDDDASGIVHLWIESYCTMSAAFRSSIVFCTAFSCFTTESGSVSFLRLSTSSAAGFIRTRSREPGILTAVGPADAAGSGASARPAPPPFFCANAAAGMQTATTNAASRVRMVNCSLNGGCRRGSCCLLLKLQQTALVCLHGRASLAMLPGQHERNGEAKSHAAQQVNPRKREHAGLRGNHAVHHHEGLLMR